MQQVLTRAIQCGLNDSDIHTNTSNRENFLGQDPHHAYANQLNQSAKFLHDHALAIFIAAVVVELLVLFFGKWIWNLVVVKLFTIVKPAKSIWQLLGISILCKLIYN